MKIILLSPPSIEPNNYMVSYQVEGSEKEMSFWATNCLRMAEVLKNTGMIDHYLVGPETIVLFDVVNEVGEDSTQRQSLYDFVSGWTANTWKLFLERYEQRNRAINQGMKKASATLISIHKQTAL